MVTVLYDVVIIGGGPAGLSAAIYAARKVLKTLLISKDLGGQVTWTYDVDNYLGFSQIETGDLIAKFEEHVEKYSVEKLIGPGVKVLELAGKTKKVITEDGDTYLTKTVIIATGKRPRLLDVPGEKELLGMGVTYCSTCDAPLFADLSSSKVEIFAEHEILRITGDSSVDGLEIKSLKTGEARRLSIAGIIVEIGLLPNSELVIDTLETNKIGEIVVDSRCRTGISGVFACGDITDIPFKQVVVAAGEGAKAALSAYDYIISQR
ncbi:MAG: FAD-dependent oxidoreductase [Deltaproteobacteria bacterium]|nr:FAD-dependent oxidoreductase [Deltaproteobacteria bacterium]